MFWYRATYVHLDRLQSALDLGFLRFNPADGTRFQVKVSAFVGYPADPNDINKIAVPKQGKYPFVALIHGNSAAWQFGGPITDTGRRLARVPLITTGGTDREDYQGYEYLQKALAELKQPIMSISFSQAFANMIDSIWSSCAPRCS